MAAEPLGPLCQRQGDCIGGRVLAFTFPGQGSQKPGMGAEWVDHESWELVEEASQAQSRDVTELPLHEDADERKHLATAN